MPMQESILTQLSIFNCLHSLHVCKKPVDNIEFISRVGYITLSLLLYLVKGYQSAIPIINYWILTTLKSVSETNPLRISEL